MDRLFLTGLVRELRGSIVGCSLRSVSFDREASLVALRTSLPRPRSLVVSLEKDVAGICRAELPRTLGPVPGLKKRLVGARIADLTISDVDRVVTLSLERTSLAGKKIRTDAVLEVAGSRVGFYVVELESRLVVEAFTRGPKRLEPGESYVHYPPPPHAAPLATSAAEFEERLSTGSKDSLLQASGLTPLLVSELQWLIERGMRAPDAFVNVNERLSQPSPTLYVTAERIQLSPIRLESKKPLHGSTFPSFNEALTTAIELATSRRRVEHRRRRLASSLERSLSKARRLRDKLTEQRHRAGNAVEYRRRAEQLLAGLRRARRIRGDAVIVPDSFDPEGGEIEIPLDPRKSLVSNAEKYFSRAKRAERSGRLLDERLDELGKFIDYLEKTSMALRDATEEPEVEQIEEEAYEQGILRPEGGPSRPPRRTEVARLAPRRFKTRLGGTILVGRSSRGNESLTFRVARPDDLWFHVAAFPGAHVVLRATSGAPAEEEIEEAAGVAAYYSRARHDSYVEVIVTERRNVSKLKGAPPGTVSVKQYRTIRVSPKADAVPDPAELETPDGRPHGSPPKS